MITDIFHVFTSRFFRSLFLIVAIVIFSGCAKNTRTIQMFLGNDFDSIYNVVDDIELIPLETSLAHVVGGNPQIEVCNDSYIIYDIENSTIGRYSHSGQFLNKIGNKGNGPGEYVDILNIQVQDEQLIVYSVPNIANYYCLTGEHIKKVELPLQGMQSYSLTEGVLTYFGYSTGSGSRLSLLKGQRSVSYLPDDANVLAYLSDAPVFSSTNNGVYILDSYSPVVYRFENNKLYPYLQIDFGPYEIPQDYYQFDDSFKVIAAV